MTQSIEESFLIGSLTIDNAIYCDSLTLKFKVDELMNYFEATDKKEKVALAVTKKNHQYFPETQIFINKACCKENISVDEVFFSIKMSNILFFYS